MGSAIYVVIPSSGSVDRSRFSQMGRDSSRVYLGVVVSRGSHLKDGILGLVIFVIRLGTWPTIVLIVYLPLSHQGPSQPILPQHQHRGTLLRA